MVSKEGILIFLGKGQTITMWVWVMKIFTITLQIIQNWEKNNFMKNNQSYEKPLVLRTSHDLSLQ